MRRGSAIAVALLAGAVGCARSSSDAIAAPRSRSALAAKAGAKAKRSRSRARVSKQPVELGKIAWLRSLPLGLARAKRSGKPVFLLFDEVPGCSTVRGYGRRVLSHPLIVEAVESLFVPVAIYNNVGGADRRVLRAFREPSWNNPVVRIIDHRRRALAPRYAGDYSVVGTARTMVAALARAKRQVPGYLAALATGRRASARATFAMHCFWTGEVKLGSIAGVAETRAGFLGGREVVEVRYDPRRLSFAALLAHARGQGVATHVFAHDARQLRAARKLGLPASRTSRRLRVSPKDDKYQLAATSWRHVPMTAAQATRLNAALPSGRVPVGLLSPRQLRLHRALRASSRSTVKARSRASLYTRACRRRGFRWWRLGC